MNTKNYSVSKNTATLLAAVEELVKASYKIGDALEVVYGDDEGNQTKPFCDAMITAREELMKLVADEIDGNLIATREAVTEI